MIVFWDNELDKYDLIISSEQGNFPAENLQDIHLINTCRTNSPEEQYIKIDAGEGNTITPKCMAIAKHNLTPSATIKFQANSEDNWSSPPLDETISHAADIMTKRFANSTGYRYCQFYFHDPTNPDDYIEIGRPSFGGYLQLPPIAPDTEIPYGTTTLVNRSITGQGYGDKGYKFRQFKVSYPLINESERAQIKSMWNEVENDKPIFLLLWEDSLDIERPIYCQINQTEIVFKRSSDRALMWEAEIEFLEAF